MRRLSFDAAVIGAGSAGMAAALRLRAAGFSIAVLEREPFLGGILQQCIHPGFGLHRFGEDLTGPEYAERFAGPLRDSGAAVYLDTTVMEIASGPGDAAERASDRDPAPPDRVRLWACSARHGAFELEARAAVLAMGCRERNRGNVAIAGSRPAGIFTAGLAQRLVNIEGYLPGRRVVIVGSGDIGLIMARRLTLAGCEVLCVVEIQAYPSGLVRNIVQCLNDFSIPLYLGHVVTRIEGRDRVEAVEIAPVTQGHPDLARSFRVACDTVLLSVGLVPENELSRAAGVAINEATGGPFVDASLQTTTAGIYACGNVLHVHDLVDFVSEEAERCGDAVAARLAQQRPPGRRATGELRVAPGANVRYVVPNAWDSGRENVLYLRSLIVKNGAGLLVTVDGREVRRRKLAHVQPSEMVRVVLPAADLPAPEPGQPNVLEVSLG